ncbi:uncharacterized protein V6R79_003902 [Siganus canaliculatus]
MASGAKVTPKAMEVCQNIKVVKCETDPLDRIRLLRFGFNEEGNIDVMECYKEKDLGEKDAFLILQKMTAETECCYLLYDCNYETKETKKNELIFMFWADDNGAIKHKMKYASSKDALKKPLSGIKHDKQINDRSAFQTRKEFAEALGLKMTTLEGVPVDP